MPLTFLLLFVTLTLSVQSQERAQLSFVHGALVRGDSTQKSLALLFTADEWAEGLSYIRKTLKKEGVRAGFFFTGRAYQNPSLQKEIQQLAKDGHYFGPHSDQHLLYCDWTKRDSLLVTKDSFEQDILRNLQQMKALGLPVATPHFFIPPYEWWNDSIAAWSRENALQLFSFTPGIRTNADYTWPAMGTAYKSTEWIMQWLKESVAATPQKWNGAVILVHAGTDPRRKDKFYQRLHEVIHHLKQNGFSFRRIDKLLQQN